MNWTPPVDPLAAPPPTAHGNTAVTIGVAILLILLVAVFFVRWWMLAGRWHHDTQHELGNQDDDREGPDCD